ncbi:MAG TPA: M56 family metallopeptidase [Clostridiaceae bacterium]|jgi:bla regulator protein BlaR1|nr:M56 family metallopeptidase [Clostridiaceae bacterium]
MKHFIIILITYSALISVIILLYIAITPILSKRYSAKSLYYSWLIIVIGLIVPYWPKINIPAVDIKVKAPAEAVLTKSLLTVPTKTAYTVTQVGNSTPLNNTDLRPALTNIQWWQFIAIIWVTGMIVFLFIHCLKHYRLVKMADRWSEDIKDDQVLALMESIKEDLGISGHISLHLCPNIGSPMMIGVFKPRILLPVVAISQGELRFILKHELVHYKRKDLWYKYLLLLATAFHWFNPVIYLMVRVVNVQCELSCDAEIVRNSNKNTRYQYCETIAGLLENQSKIKTALSTNFYGGKSGMKNRFMSIMDTRKKRVGLFIICATLIITTGVGIVCATVSSDSTTRGLPDNVNLDVDIKIAGNNITPENYGTSVCYVDARPQLEFFIEGEDIAQIEVSCQNEYVYAVDWTKTQHEKYWNIDYYQTYDKETQTCTFYPERLYDKTMKFQFNEGFKDYGDIWYRWTAWNLNQWATEDNYSHIVGYGIEPKIELSDDMTEEQKLMLTAGEDGSGVTNIGHICLDGCPEELTWDRITIKIMDRDGNSVTKYINVEIINNEYDQTVVTASLEN